MNAGLSGRKLHRIFARITGAFLVLLFMFSYMSSPASADNEAYGEEAYACLQFIDQNLGYRISDVKKTTDTRARDNAGNWIVEKLHEYGYKNVNPITIDLAGNHAVSYYVRKPGNSQNRLVIGAHYDCVETKGVEDNGTGVAVCLELAKRFLNTETPLTIDFCFFDGEETIGYAGAYSYLEQLGTDGIFCYMNLDCLGAGDIMYVYGGDYEGDTLVRDWGYNMARTVADELGTPLSALPAAIGDPRTPTRPNSSDHYYFNQKGIPYIYLEANRWVKPDGTRAREEKPHFYNSADPGFAATGGQIIHTTEFEDLKTIESIVPGRMKNHMTAYAHIASVIIRTMDENAPARYSVYTEKTPEPSTEPTTEETSEEPVTEASTETEEETSGESTPEQTEESTKETETEVKTTEGTAGTTEKEAEPSSAEESSREAVKRPGITLDRISIIYLAAASAAIIGLVLLIIFSFRGRRSE